MFSPVSFPPPHNQDDVSHLHGEDRNNKVEP